MHVDIPDFSKARILVVGDVMLDRYWHGNTQRISPEAPVPVVSVAQTEERPGGAGNVALNIAALEAQVTLLGIVGHDTAAHTLEHALHSAHVQHKLVHSAEAPTITKLRVLCKHQQLIRLDFEEMFSKDALQALFSSFEDVLEQHHVVILSDYGKGTLQHAKKFIALARKKNIPVFVDPKSTHFGDYEGATVITPNLQEFEKAVGAWKSEEELVEKAQTVLQQHHISALLITRSEHGMTLIQKDTPELHIPTRAQEVFDVTGAGDTVISILATAIGADMDLPEAMKLANTAAGITVSKLGAASVSIPELRRAVQYIKDGGVMNESQLQLAILDAHAHGEKIVMTNGCFDILHPGHVAYLNEARKLGDKLIVAVNDDASIKRLKGSGRPINTLEKRMAVLEGLSAVDWIIPFSEDTPEKLINALLPDVLVKGGDWKIEDIAGSKAVLANGGEVKSLCFIPGHSTTSVIEKIHEGENL